MRNNPNLASEIENKVRENILKYHMNNGVYIVDPKSTFIDADVVIEKGVKIMPNNNEEEK